MGAIRNSTTSGRLRRWWESFAAFRRPRLRITIPSRNPMSRLFAEIKKWSGTHGTKALIVLILAVQVVFAIAFFYFGSSIREIEVAKDTHWWTPWIPVVAALIATAGVLITLYTNKGLSERQFDRRAQESLFTDILNRFAAKNPIIRANAAIRLAEMARKNWPGKPEQKTPDNFPFFPDAASQLAAALYMENNRAVRDEIAKALARMADFAKQDDQLLLHLLIRELADANRSARAAFVDVLAEGCSRVKKVSKEDLLTLVPFAPFCAAEEMSWACLVSLANSKECRAAATSKAIRRKAQTAEEQREADLRLLPDIESCADRLMATRDTLATALCALAAPVDLPSNAAQVRNWKRAPPLALKRCFLAEATLFDAQLQGADLQGALLQSANLIRTRLQGAALMQAECQSASMTGVQAQGATLTETYLQRANLVGAQLQETFLGWANFLEAKLSGADLTGANLAGARLFDVRVDEETEANLMGLGGLDKLAQGYLGTPLFQDGFEAIFGKRNFTAANFTGTNWWKANFTRPSGTLWWEINFERGHEIDEGLRTWLGAHFPQPTSDDNVGAAEDRSRRAQ